MFRRLLVAVFCLACLSAVASQFLYNPKFQGLVDNGYPLDELEIAENAPIKRAFSFQAARGKKSLGHGDKRYSYLPSRG